MSELLCPKCSSDKIVASKDGKKIKLTCLSCGQEFEPGQGATSLQDFKNKKKLEKQAGIGCGVLILIVIIIVIISKLCANYNNSNQAYKGKADSYSFIFYIDKPLLTSDPLDYLEKKRMEISVGYEMLKKKTSNIQELERYIKEVIKFDSLIISDLDGSIDGIGYLTFNIPESNNPNRQMNVFVSSNNIKDNPKVIFYQERHSNQFNGISPDKNLYNQIKQMQFNKVKFKALFLNFNMIDSKIKEYEIGDKRVDDEFLLDLYKDFTKNRGYRVEFKSVEKILN